MASASRTMQDVMLRFPKRYIDYAFCYGSAAFQQTNSNMANNVLDFIFVVNDSKRFHADNLKSNASDYSFVRCLGPNALTTIQGRGVYFNTLIKHGERIIKYGIIHASDFATDLIDWETLYVSGRLHKPVHVVHDTQSPLIHEALKKNLQSAVNCSLLLLPEKFTEKQLYLTIASLSYSGDFRMTFGEDKNKVSNIVSPNIPHFKNLYQSTLEENGNLTLAGSDGVFVQKPDSAARLQYINQLPMRLKEGFQKYKYKNESVESLHRRLSEEASLCSESIKNSINGIVKSSSYNQTIKSALTAGFSKSIVYSFAKIKKMLFSKG